MSLSEVPLGGGRGRRAGGRAVLCVLGPQDSVVTMGLLVERRRGCCAHAHCSARAPAALLLPRPDGAQRGIVWSIMDVLYAISARSSKGSST